MKSFFTQLAGLALTATVLLSSCEKDETQTKLNINATPTLTSSATSAALTKANASATAVTYTWTPANFGYSAAVTYTLQFAKQGTNFTNVYEVNAGNALSKSFTVEELNAVFEGVDCNSANTLTKLDVRVKSTVGTAAPETNSAVSSIQATPYPALTPPADKWAIIGSATAGGWGTDTYMTYDLCSRAYKITLPLGTGAFKFRPNGDWPGNLGGDGTANKSLKVDGADIPVSAAGTYEVSLNLNSSPKPTYTITKK